MRILLVAMSNSIHTARWISQVSDRGWDLHLFPSVDFWVDVHPELRDVTVYHSGYRRQKSSQDGVVFRGVSLLHRLADLYRRRVAKRKEPDYRVLQLVRLMDRLRPDIVHSLEIQHAGYLTCEARKLSRSPFPPWIVTNWGSDIYLFGRLPEHAPKIRELLSSCDYYSCECLRDVSLAKSFGLRGKVLPVFPNTGGFDMDVVSRLRSPGPVSARRTILLKGYQHWAGRALVGLAALGRCADLLPGYEIVLYSATPDVAVAAELFRQDNGIPVRILPKDSPHQEILRHHGRARISIGVSISDAISTSLLEAMVMGSFPVQSSTACADEWIEDGRTGLLVPPDDPGAVEAAIRRALTDDDLVDRAAEINFRTAAERLDRVKLAPMAAEIYQTVAKERKIGSGAGR
ncbi:MAG: glycosyltransferase [Candidatus Deferrimicrobiaceae bacterium]